MNQFREKRVQRQTFVNSISTGVVTGVIVPTIFFFVTYLTKYAEIPFKEYIDIAMEKGAMVYLLSISAFPNLIIFFLANQYNKNLFQQGLVRISIVWIVVIFALKGYFWMTL
ncbi:hypothetical protein K4L44_13510 [Halosquirtibacter laminarini]|uniref:Uncharacterized protein n=1 Tax=Halosquirtibacter laminarini TaxID=3374600 RepID=A0AC61NMU2_9BACT|nr:hypothetical protein K4L44_13510 [Prolixibacteraceae bacterium]